MIGIYLPRLVKASQKEWWYDYVLLSVTCVPKGVEATSPRRNPTLVRQAHNANEAKNSHANDRGIQEGLELLGRDMRSYKFRERDDLEKTKDTCTYPSSASWTGTNKTHLTKRSHVFAGANRLEPYEGNLHTG